MSDGVGRSVNVVEAAGASLGLTERLKNEGGYRIRQMSGHSLCVCIVSIFDRCNPERRKFVLRGASFNRSCVENSVCGCLLRLKLVFTDFRYRSSIR